MNRRNKDVGAVAPVSHSATETARKKNRRMRALVPRVVFSTIFIGVVPACVASACGGSTTSNGGPDATSDVAAACFAGSTNPACSQLGVAAVAFQCFDGSTQPGCPHPVDAATDGAGDALDDADADGAG